MSCILLHIFNSIGLIVFLGVSIHITFVYGKQAETPHYVNIICNKQSISVTNVYTLLADVAIVFLFTAVPLQLVLRRYMRKQWVKS